MNPKNLMEEAVEKQMPAARWQHTQGVVEAAAALAKRYGADPEKAEMAALLHDYCKSWPVNKQRELIERHAELPQDILNYDKQLWHAWAGAYTVQHQFQIADEELLDAIRYHTSGRQNMTILDKVVCLADYIERGRNFAGVDRIREIAETHLEKALLAGFDSTLNFLLLHGKKIYPLTVDARNGLIDELNEEVS